MWSSHVLTDHTRGPWPSGYVVMSMCSALREPGCYMTTYLQHVRRGGLTTADVANSLSPYTC